MNKKLLLFGLFGLLVVPSSAQRTERTLEKGWLFTKTNAAANSSLWIDESSWQSVTIPHDWAIYGPFDYNSDPQNVAISQDGQKEAMTQAGRTGGLPFVGYGWYRLHLAIPEYKEGKRVQLMFDGAMSNAKVWVNNQYVGTWPYGYNSFFFDVTKYIKTSGSNLIAIQLHNETESSRWYPGAGLYRNVHLRVTEAENIPIWGVNITTPTVSASSAMVNVKTTVAIPTKSFSKGKFRLVSTVKDNNGGLVATTEKEIASSEMKKDSCLITQTINLSSPSLWSPDSPNLYTLTSQLYCGTTLCDTNNQRFGVRSISYSSKGVQLNGETIKFRGVCNHHDLGPLGAAVNESAIRRQIRLLKNMGCNAIRTSHNMPAPELIDACDEMGMMVMCETFDEWKAAKCKNGYNKYFDQWYAKDLQNVVRHYRNNPSVVMWSIGNEVSENWQNNDYSANLSKKLQDVCHAEDPTRAVTQGLDNPDATKMASVMDIPGFNYRTHKYSTNISRLPQKFLLGTETASTVSSRGVYKFPVKRGSMVTYADHQSSSYDVQHCSWSDLPEDNFLWNDDNNWMLGEFVWTGFDYLGEPTPYYTEWPSHSSLFGIIDLAGIPKDRYYLYRSHWNPSEETLHILPHWTWPGREGQTTPVYVYTNQPKAELFVNGKSQGVVSKKMSVKATNTDMSNLNRQARYRLCWNNVKYEAGVLKVVSYDEKGKVVSSDSIKTAGAPDHLEILTEESAPSVCADGKDIAFLRVRMVDKDGTLCPNDSSIVSFNVTGAGVYRAAANGDPICMDIFHKPQMHLFNGELTLLVQSVEGQKGVVNVTATAKNVKQGEIQFSTITPISTGVGNVANLSSKDASKTFDLLGRSAKPTSRDVYLTKGRKYIKH